MADISSLLDVNNGAPFEMLMVQLMSPTNAERQGAEAAFNELKKQPDICVTHLARVLRGSQSVEARGLAAILLRKVLTREEDTLWPKITDATQVGVKAELLKCIEAEQEHSITKKVCDTVGELAAGILEDGKWPELLPFMFQCVNSTAPKMQESALLIFAQLAEYMAPSLGNYLGTLHGVLQKCLGQGNHLDVRIAALRATTSFIQGVEESKQRDGFQDLLPVMLQTLGESLNAGEELAAQEAIEMFIEVGEMYPRFLRKQLVDVVNSMLTVAEAESLDDATRHLAAEFLVTLTEARDKAPGMMRKLPQFIGRIFQCFMMFLLDVEDEPEWHLAEGEENEEAGQGDRYDVGQECLDRMAIAVGGKTVLPLAQQLVPQFLGDSQDWRKRHAGLITLAQIAEGCSKQMAAEASSACQSCLALVADAHPRVRWAAFQAIGQLCTDLGPDLQQQEHARVLPALVGAMDDFNNPRVQAHATAALVNFSEGCPHEILPPYLDGVVSKLLTLLQSGKKMVQEGALTALASVADCAQATFVKYYDACMPFLKTILTSANQKEHRMLRAKSLECISLVGMAVGKERFRNDAKEVMDVLMALQGSGLDEDDPTVSYMLQAWARLCKCLGQEFLPYLSVVMPPLLHSAQLKPDVKITDIDDVQEDEDEDEGEMEMIQLGDKRISIKTSVLEEKATACNMLCCYADELKEGFYPYVEQVTQIMVPLLKFYFHEEVRKAAASSLPQLLNCAKLAVEKGCGKDAGWVKQMVAFTMAPLLEAMAKEVEPDILATMLEALNESVTVAGQLIQPEEMGPMFETLRGVMEKSRERRQERGERTQHEDFDEEEQELLEEENQQEEEVLDNVGECICSLIKVHGARLLPLLEALMPQVNVLAQANSSPEERRVAICIFDDIVEHASEGGGSLKYLEHFLPMVLESCVDTNCDVRQAAVYGVGVCAQHAGPVFSQATPQALAQLQRVVGAPDARSKDNAMATENAISALGKICEFQRAAIDGAKVMPAWLSLLPLTEDTVEARLVHAQLCRFIEAGDTQLMGPSHENVPGVVRVFADVLARGTELATEEGVAKMAAILRQMQGALPEVFGAAGASLLPAQQAVLQAVVSGQPLPISSPTAAAAAAAAQ